MPSGAKPLAAARPLKDLFGKLTPYFTEKCPFTPKPKANAPVKWVEQVRLGGRIPGVDKGRQNESAELSRAARMPVILAEEHHAKWLGEIEDGDLKQLLKQYAAEEMKMWPISQRVNSPKYDDPSLLEPIRV
jgi:hypothetical protein